MSASERLLSFGFVVATTAGATFVVLFGGSFGWIGSRIGYDAIAIGTLVPWFLVRAVRGRGLPHSHLMPAIGACLAAFAISTVTSRVPRISLEMLGYAILLAALYLGAVALLRRPRMRSQVAAIALVLCVGICLLYLTQVFSVWQAWWSLLGRMAIPPLRPGYLGLNVGSPNPLAALVLLLGGFACGSAAFHGRAGTIGAALLVALVGAVVLVSGSRGGWVGTAAALAVVVTAAFVSNTELRRRATSLVRSRLGAASAVVFTFAVVGAAAIAGLSGRLTLDDEGRQLFTTISQRMFQSSPLTGTGPGTWPILRAGFTAAGEGDPYVPHAHSVYWQLLAEIGLLGMVAGIVVAISVGWLIVRALRSSDTSRRRVALAAVFGVVLMAVHQSVDMFMNVPPILFAVGLPIAWLDATTEKSPAAGRSTHWAAAGVSGQRALPLAAAGAIGLIAVGLFTMEWTTTGYLSAVAAADSGNWADATTLARRAAAGDPEVAAYQFTLGVAAANSGDLPLAEAALAKSASADDYTYAWLNLAAVRWRMGDLDGARVALSSAERLGLQRPTVALPAGWLRQQLADQPGAISDYVAALLGAPTLAADPFWDSTTDLRAAWPTVWSKVQATADARTLLVLDLVTGRTDLANQAAATLAGSDAVLYEWIVSAWNGDSRSWTMLQALAIARPSDGDTLAWCQLIGEHRRDEAAANRYAEWIAIGASPLPSRPQLASITTATTEPVAPSVFDSYELLYRRPVPAAQIVEIVPQVTW